jgi:hypothetical protein
MRILRPRVAIVVGFAAVLGSLACNDSTATYPLGKLSVQVLDASNNGIQGVAADLYKVVDGGAILWRAGLTSSNGIAVFGASDGGVIAGDYYIHISFSSLHQLAPGETNDRPVTVNEGDDLTVTFHAVANEPGF